MSTTDAHSRHNPGRAAELVYRQRINHLLAYIQEHLDQPLKLQVLASVAGFSPFHLHRIFAAFVGEPLGEYTRRLRLRLAAHLLANSRESITQIGFAAGYETPAAFAKAFRQTFALSPSQFRQRGEQAFASMPRRIERSHSERRSFMQPEIKELPAQRVIYVRRRGLINNNFDQAADEAFDVLCAYIDRQHAWGEMGACLGITPDESNDTAPGEAIYDGGFILQANARIQPAGEVQIQVIPAGRWAVFKHHGPYNTLWQTWNAIYRDWLPSSGERLRDTAPYEIYLSDKHKTPEAELESEIYIPIQ